jgi:hypothetical protein
MTLANIPFVKEEWSKTPRPAPPLSAVLTEDEAATLIQAGYRGYIVRRDPEVQVFRQWLRGYRKEIESAVKIQRFWRKHHNKATHIPPHNTNC